MGECISPKRFAIYLYRKRFLIQLADEIKNIIYKIYYDQNIQIIEIGVDKYHLLISHPLIRDAVNIVKN